MALLNGSRVAAWQARWYVWDGGFFALGTSDVAIGEHDHHAIQLTVALEGAFALRTPGGDWTEYDGALVAPDERHAFDGRGAPYAMVFVDPESREGRWLRRGLHAPVTPLPAEARARHLPALRACYDAPLAPEEAARMLNAFVRDLCAGPPPPRPLDPRVVRALETIRRMDAAKVSLEAVARVVYLSPSRLAHLFSEEVGLPFRRYVLWRRLTRAMLAVGRGGTLSAAAHASGFADAAHLTRACTQMFGLAPSLLLKAGEFYETPAPFELPYAIG